MNNDELRVAQALINDVRVAPLWSGVVADLSDIVQIHVITAREGTRALDMTAPGGRQIRVESLPVTSINFFLTQPAYVAEFYGPTPVQGLPNRIDLPAMIEPILAVGRETVAFRYQFHVNARSLFNLTATAAPANQFLGIKAAGLDHFVFMQGRLPSQLEYQEHVEREIRRSVGSVRAFWELQRGHAPGAQHVPLEEARLGARAMLDGIDPQIYRNPGVQPFSEAAQEQFRIWMARCRTFEALAAPNLPPAPQAVQVAEAVEPAPAVAPPIPAVAPAPLPEQAPVPVEPPRPRVPSIRTSIVSAPVRPQVAAGLPPPLPLPMGPAAAGTSLDDLVPAAPAKPKRSKNSEIPKDVLDFTL